MTIIINPYEGYPIINGYSAAHEGQDFGTPRIMDYVAASDGVVVQTGGEFNQIIVRMNDGRYWRTAENAQILVSVGQRISIFQVIARNAFYRGGIYRSPHINGGGDNGRSIFTNMVTMTQAQAHAALTPAPTNPKIRVTIAVGANVRSTPEVSPTNLQIPFKANTAVMMEGFVHGGVAKGSDLWFRHALGYSHVSGFTDGGTHDLPDLTPVAPPVVTPPVIVPPVEPPVVVVPPVVVPPVVTPDPVPPVVTPPAPVPPVEKRPTHPLTVAGLVTLIATVVGAFIAWITTLH